MIKSISELKRREKPNWKMIELDLQIRHNLSLPLFTFDVTCFHGEGTYTLNSHPINFGP